MTNYERHYLISVMKEKIAKLNCERFSVKDTHQCYLAGCIKTLEDYTRQLESEIDLEISAYTSKQKK